MKIQYHVDIFLGGTFYPRLKTIGTYLVRVVFVRRGSGGYRGIAADLYRASAIETATNRKAVKYTLAKTLVPIITMKPGS